MDVSTAIKSRYSVRAYRPDPVPEDTLREIIEIARHAPSNSNTQPWHIAIVSGQARHELERRIFEFTANGGEPHPAFPPGGVGLKGVYKERQYDCAFRYYGTMGVSRDDKDARQKLLIKNWEFYGAPHAAFISMPETMHRANAIDIGIFLQSIMLLFAERGISCIPQGALAAFPSIVKERLDIPEGNAIMCGLSFGYEAEGERINTVRMPREPLETVASFTS